MVIIFIGPISNLPVFPVEALFYPSLILCMKKAKEGKKKKS